MRQLSKASFNGHRDHTNAAHHSRNDLRRQREQSYGTRDLSPVYRVVDSLPATWELPALDIEQIVDYVPSNSFAALTEDELDALEVDQFDEAYADALASDYPLELTPFNVFTALEGGLA